MEMKRSGSRSSAERPNTSAGASATGPLFRSRCACEVVRALSSKVALAPNSPAGTSVQMLAATAGSGRLEKVGDDQHQLLD